MTSSYTNSCDIKLSSKAYIEYCLVILSDILLLNCHIEATLVSTSSKVDVVRVLMLHRYSISTAKPTG